MVVYRVHEKQLTPQLTAEFIYESSPVIAGTDDFSVLIRFKYTQNSKPVRSEHNQPVEKNDEKETGSWLGSRLSSQFSNATRALFLNSLDNIDEEKNVLIEEETPRIDIFLGFTQVLGHYSVNDTIVETSIFKELQKSAILEGKLAGIHGLEINEDLDSNSLMGALSSLYNSELNSINDYDVASHMNIVPFFSTNQNIMFSQLTFDPKQWTPENFKQERVKSFYLTAKLPKTLPPSFDSEAVQITYNLVFGYQVLKNNQLVNKTVFVPLKIQPYIDSFSRQPIYHLEKNQLNYHLSDVREMDVSNHPSVRKHDLTESLTKRGKRISFWNIKTKNDISDSRRPSTATTFEALKKMSLSDIKDVKGTEDIKKFMGILEDMNQINVNNISNLQEEFERQFNDNDRHFNVRENLIQILGDLRHLKQFNEKEDENGSDEIRDFDYEHLIPREVQTKFAVKQNHNLITSLSLNKGVFKVGDSISLNLSFVNAKYYTTGVEIQLLKHQNFYREEYLKLDSYDSVNPMLMNNSVESVLYESLFSTFNTENLNVDILIPFKTESQFKTNFFTLKYYVQVRFIMNDVYGLNKKKAKKEEEGEEEDKKMKLEKFDLKKIFVDYGGSVLYQPEDTLDNANEFIVRIPVFILPNYEHDFGKVTSEK